MEKLPDLDLAYEFLLNGNGKQFFNDIWNYVCEHQGYTEEDKVDKIGKFYTRLSLDDRFVQLEENEWNLRNRESFDKVHAELNSIYSYDDDDEINDDDDEDESISIDDDEDESSDEDFDSKKEEL